MATRSLHWMSCQWGPDHVFVAAGKIEFVVANDWSICSGRGFSRKLKDLHTWRSARAEIAAQACVEEVAAVHALSNKAWRSIPAIPAWKTANTQPVMRRRKNSGAGWTYGLGKNRVPQILVRSLKNLRVKRCWNATSIFEGFQSRRA